MNSFNKTICVQCKVYYGSEERNGMCSVCFKDFKNKQGTQEVVNNQNEKSVNSEINSNVNVTDVTNNTISNSNAISTSTTTTIQTEDVKMEEPVVETNTRPVQTNPHSCWICNKKVGYLGFKCKCEYIFCGTHRHFSDHNCDFDYKSYDRSKLVKKSGLEPATDNNKMIK